ncbi:MAG: hypothetical protein LAP85_15315 [Acidobacteriia bacterium]|nr:hypothetical protein [Terriglobia bacterium]
MNEMTIEQKVRAARKAIDKLMETVPLEVNNFEIDANFVRRFRSVLRTLRLPFHDFAETMDSIIRVEFAHDAYSSAFDQFLFCTAA